MSRHDQMSNDPTPTRPEVDVQAVRSLIAMAEKYQNDPDRFIPLHTADVTIVNIAGRRVSGRDEFHRAMTAALATPLTDVLTTIEVDDVRFVRPDVAIVSATKIVSDQRQRSEDDPVEPLPSTGRLTYVVVKDLDDWRISLAQTTPVSD